jgi:hypothetical protein
MGEEELEEIKESARAEGMTVSSWVRRAIRHERLERPGKSVRNKQKILSKAAEYGFPTGDYEEMAAEIEDDYLKGLDQ